MPRYTAEQIYAFARQAGFTPDEAATMTAVALAESGGNSNAHNPHGEDSRGLWQINVNAHPHFGQIDLYDPAQNARAAFEVSHGGDDISPWTTTHGGLSARYLRYRAQAEAAAMSYGDGSGHGMWTGSSGYGDTTPAGLGEEQSQDGPGGDAADGQAGGRGGGHARAGEQYGIGLETDEAPQVPDAPDTLAGGPEEPGGGAGPGAGPGAGSSAGSGDGAEYGIALESPSGETPAPQGTPAPSPADATKLQAFLDAALAQTGDQYIFGAETRLDDPNPSTYDCSELVEWAAHQAGVKVPDGAWAQYTTLHGDNAAIPVQNGIDTPGALLFSFSSDPLTGKPNAAHVAISLGNGKTIEAMGTQYGVGSWNATTGRFQYAAIIPGMSAPGAPPAPPTEPQPPPPDAFDQRLENDPAQLDGQSMAIEASERLTYSIPIEHPAPEPPPADSGSDLPPDAGPDIGSDVNVDGVDDALAHATELADAPQPTQDSHVDDDAATTA